MLETEVISIDAQSQQAAFDGQTWSSLKLVWHLSVWSDVS